MASFLSFFKGVEALEGFMKACRGDAKDWYVGISHDEIDRLTQHGQQDNPYAATVDNDDGQTTRLIEKHFKDYGMQGDTGGEKPENPPTQIYVYRVPKIDAN